MKFTSAATLFLFVASFASDAVARTNSCKAKKGSNSTVNAHSGGSSYKNGHKKAAAGYKSSASAWSSSYAPTSTKSSSSAKSTKGASSNDDGGSGGTTSTNNLRTSCNPGGNFDLSKWMLQLPTFDSHGGVQSLQAEALSGCGGFKLSNYFYTGSDGAMVMKAPGSDSGCAITGGSKHCRTELGEKSPSSWKPSADTNRLYAKLKGVSGDTVVIGQAFQANSGFMKPIAELNYDSDGSLNMRVATRKQGGGGQDSNPLGKVPHGTVFTYEIRYEKDKLCVSINGASCKNIPLNFDSPGAFFKAGDYNQADADAEIHFYELTITH